MTSGLDPSQPVPTALQGLPRATVRLQLHRGFTLDDAATRVPYFAALGLSHVYASPLLTARGGSIHGYDGVDPTRISAELGGEPALRRLVEALRRHGMGLIVDIVPNHMAVGSENPWWMDVLAWGLRSRHARWFDIDWAPADPAMHGKLLLPVLGKPYGEALLGGELVPALDAARGRLELRYFDHRFPLAPDDYVPLLQGEGDDTLQPQLRPHLQDFQAALALPGEAAHEAFDAACLAFGDALRDTGLRGQCEAALARWAVPPQPQGQQAAAANDAPPLHAVLERQAWRLAWWRTASDQINWRRFFDVHELVGLNVERPEVFDGVHATVLRLVQEGLVDGLRIDHVDGLTDPGVYCQRLRRHVQQRWPHDPARRPFYLVVEKILARDEPLRAEWTVDGSTGYDFMNQVSEWLHQPGGEAPLAALWAGVSGRSASFEPEALEARRELLSRSFDAQLNATVAALREVAGQHLNTRDITAAAIQRALVELLVHFPVYRTYALAHGFDAIDAAHMGQAIAAARSTCRADDAPVLDLLHAWLGGEPLQDGGADVPARRNAIRLFQQLSAPLAAKAIEDTAFYRHGRLLSRNDVGFDPAVFASDAARWHAVCEQRRERFPAAMLASATHDHKRGEDVRARLAVLSERPGDWQARIDRWLALNAAHRGGAEAPTRGDEAMLYQVLVGAWPLELLPDDAAGLQAFGERVLGWQQKALREAKLATDWIAHNDDYEGGSRRFLQALLSPPRAAAFLHELHAWVQETAPAAAANGLVQTLLKYTAPGMPDLYQGTEFWDLSLVDPDNRRPVDFAARAEALERHRGQPLAALRAHWRDGALKQALIARLLACRAAAPALFAQGEYRPLAVQGPSAGHLLAFERCLGPQRLVVVAARWPWQLGGANALDLPGSLWPGHALQVPDAAEQDWHDPLEPQAGAGEGSPGSRGLPALEQLLSPLPFAVRANFPLPAP
jgi:(1->4)-alpha-D-glucan 1-alpha-D-glucosylmutase